MSQRRIDDRLVRPRLEHWYVAAFLAVGVVFPLLYLDQPLHFDEAIYLVIADEMASGGTLYVDVADHKPPGIFALAAVAVELFAQPHRVLRLATYAVTAVSGLLVYALGRRVRDRQTGMVASVLFLLITYMPHFDGFFYMTEPWSVVMLVSAALLFLTADPVADVATGVALGVGVLFNQTVFLFGATILAFFALGLRYPERRTWAYLRRCGARVLLVGVGFCALTSVALTVFYARGTLDRMLYYAYYLPLSSYSTPFELYGHLLALLTLLPVWLVAGWTALGIGADFGRGRHVPDGVFFVALWAVVLSVPGATAFAGDHKFLFAFPAIAVLTALGLREVYDSVRRDLPSLADGLDTLPSRSTVVAGFLLATVVLAAGANLKHGTTRLSNDITAEAAAADRVDDHVDGPVFVYSSQNSVVYFSEDLSPAVRWIGQPYADSVIESILVDLRQHENAPVVVDRDRLTGDGRVTTDIRYYQETKAPLVDYLNDNYEPAERTEEFVVFRPSDSPE